MYLCANVILTHTEKNNIISSKRTGQSWPVNDKKMASKSLDQQCSVLFMQQLNLHANLPKIYILQHASICKSSDKYSESGNRMALRRPTPEHTRRHRRGDQSRQPLQWIILSANVHGSRTTLCSASVSDSIGEQQAANGSRKT